MVLVAKQANSLTECHLLSSSSVNKIEGMNICEYMHLKLATLYVSHKNKIKLN